MPPEWARGDDAWIKDVMAPAMSAAMAAWHQSYLPMHFQAGAAEKYNYKPRTRKYWIQKMRYANKHNPEARNPLTYTGLMKAMTQMGIAVTVKSAGRSGHRQITSVKGVMQAPRYVHMFSKGATLKGGNHPYLAGEATAVTQGEMDYLFKIIEDKITTAMNRNTQTSVVTV